MNIQGSTEQAAFALDREWVIVTQPAGERFHFAIARRDTILLQGIFSLEPGQVLGDRLEQVSRELRNGRLHEAFHKMTRSLGVKIRKPQSCKGTCPWVCPGNQFVDVNEKYALKVPQDLRRRGLRIFQGWEMPIIGT